MRKLLFTAIILFACFTFKHAEAQLNFSVGVNIGNQPDWGPVGYDHANYYYMPDINGYYDVNAHQYIYQENNVWVHRGNLPDRYRKYDLYRGYKVVVNGRNPWIHNDVYRQRYAAYRGRHDQAVIRDSHDDRYRNHWHGDNGNHGNDHGDHGGGDHRGGDHGDHGGNDHGDHGHH